MTSIVQQMIMNSIIGENKKTKSVTISFRCSEELAEEIKIISSLVGNSSQSSFLTELTQAAIQDSLAALPPEIYKEYEAHMETFRLKSIGLSVNRSCDEKEKGRS